MEYWKTPSYKRMIEQKVDARIAAAVVKEGFGSVASFIQAKTEADMLRIPNLGRKSVDKIKEMAVALGLRLGFNDNYPGMASERDGFRIEAALDCGFKVLNDDATVYSCTEGQLLELIRRVETSFGPAVLSPAIIASALGCFWNAAIGAAHERQNSTAFDMASIMAEGVQAVANRLGEELAGK